MRNTILTLCVLIGISAYMSGCKKQDFNYRQFIGDGEITYIGKADSLSFRGGNHRVELSWLLVADPKVTSYKVYWDNRQDSTSGPLVKTGNVDTVKLIVENLEEKIYEFEVFLLDNEGNSSVVSSTVGQVYGDRYQSGLLNRVFKTPRVMPNNELELEWSWAENTLLYSEVRYQDINNETVTHIIKTDTELDTIREFPSGNTFEVRSAFLPDTSAIDTFYTDYVSFETQKVDKWWEMDFSTTLRYGNQTNQFSVWVSQDFNGIYELEDVEVATWINVTDEFTLATSQTVTTSSSMDIGSLLLDDQHFYVAFRYDFVPGLETTQRTWTVREFKVASQITDEILFDQAVSDFQLVTKGSWETGRLMLTSELITLRGNSADTTTPVTAWAISKKIE